MTSPYAWVIDMDHLSEPGGEFYDPAKPDDNCVGIAGPRTANGYTKVEFRAKYQHHHQYRMYDRDGILYVTGTLFWNGRADDPDSASATLKVRNAPLRDYAKGGRGCVSVRYTGKPEWDCG